MLKGNLKRVAVKTDQTQIVDADARKYKTLSDDYFILLKESVSMKRKLRRTQQKRAILMAEVQFLRKRYRCLTDGESHNLQVDDDAVPAQAYAAQSEEEDTVKAPRPVKKPRIGLINGKNRIDKKKISWQDQPALIDSQIQ
ncbi:uncharacterized protein LOC126667106 [Mercurialis annua]|uniref:uncharacterized protein LOC126667106 n=1 Tax=Mercurialis annua TaxID=3986 RepID=UPI002160181D|nr:uncharacterized protein LOC126667106 [Mercurialis annua]